MVGTVQHRAMPHQTINNNSKKTRKNLHMILPVEETSWTALKVY
jgi:hypothetical protein